MKSKREWALWVRYETVADMIRNVANEPMAADPGGQVPARIVANPRTRSFGGKRQYASADSNGGFALSC